MTPEELSALIASCVDRALDAAGVTGLARPEVKIERPRSKEHGDYATSVALQLAKPVGRQPREIAELIAGQLRNQPGIASVDVAGPGFLNIRLEADALGALAGMIVEQGSSYGTGESLAGQYLNLEFVSANPTGPLHIGHVRWAAVGDALGRLLEAAGARVVREYYFNDAGVQIERFALSLDAALRGEATPEDGYGGAYIQEIAAAVGERYPDLADRHTAERLEVLRADGMALMFDEIKRTLSEFGVHFDVYFSEASLHRSGAVERAVERLRAHGNVYEQDGAVWLRTTGFGDDKDRVLVKSDGSTTYFTADLAYYLDKRDRGFDRAIYMLGADHHGYIGRMRAMVRCYGEDPDQTLEILIGQMVNLYQDGAPVRMSKRAGTGLTLAELVEAVGVDAARYSLARSSTDTTLDLDLDMLTQASNDNPVYYVQYAHARIANLIRQAAESGHIRGPLDATLLSAPQEAELLAALGEFPRIVATAAAERAPHRIARYLETSVAPSYHRFYDACRVLPPAGEDLSPLGSARLWLCEATRIVLANGLALLGVSAPERL